ncbi:MAG: hypothetical protein QOH58_579 [Thermoleophilaceae bacterium]|jgi:hypothetical protein|nr:hypothetical protein [Thermoleophilaceae bacterium]
MSEIPFVNRLGDALESAVAAPAPARRRLGRRRLGVLALAVFLLGASGATVARIMADPEQLAIGVVACYERPDLSGGVSVTSADGRSPTAVCARTWTASGKTAPPLVACAQEAAIAVIPGRGPAACGRAGLEPMPAGYGVARAKVARLTRDVAALEAAADCIPPRTLARRTQALLRRTGWSGWRAVARPGGGGPCGRILQPGGSPDLSLAGGLGVADRELSVMGGPPRSLDRRLYGRSSLAVALMDASGERCFTVAGLQAHARRVLAVTGRPVRFRIGRLPANTGVVAPRGDRYEQGCAIAVGAAPVYPSPGEVAVEVEIWSKGG